SCFFGKFVGRELREIYCSRGLFFEAARCRACASRTVDNGAPAGLSALIGAVNKLESSVIPLLARPQGGVAASSNKFRAATEADAAGVVFHLFSSENHPGLAVSGGFAIIF